MKSPLGTRRTRVLIAVGGPLAVGIAYLVFLRVMRPVPPAVPVVSNCGEAQPGMRRIGEHTAGFEYNAPAFKFDVPSGDVMIHEDRPTETDVRGFELTPRNAKSSSYLDISWGSNVGAVGALPEDPILAFSGPVERRIVFDYRGRRIGEDTWGYWGNGERWRRVRLVGWVVVRYGAIKEKDKSSYGSVHKQDAELFDRVINSVCIALP